MNLALMNSANFLIRFYTTISSTLYTQCAIANEKLIILEILSLLYDDISKNRNTATLFFANQYDEYISMGYLRHWIYTIADSKDVKYFNGYLNDYWMRTYVRIKRAFTLS